MTGTLPSRVIGATLAVAVILGIAYRLARMEFEEYPHP